jgi:hypothetical protein
MKRFIALGSLLVCSIAVQSAEPTPSSQTATPEQLKAVRLVNDLGDSRFKVRAMAATELKKMGRIAKMALQEGMKSTDTEIWNRCIQLLPEVLALDLKARVDAFLADTEGKQKHELPLQELFQKVVGNDPGARKLYADIVRNNAAFLEACEQNPKLAGEKYNVRAFELQQTLFGPWSGVGARPQLQAADLAALFLIGADAEMTKNIPTSNANPVSNFLWQQQFQSALKNGDQALAYRKLFFAWAEYRTDVNSVSQTLSVVQNNNLKEGLDFAVKVMKAKDQQIWSRAQAMTVVGKMGSKDHVAAFETMFDDKTQVTTIQWNNIQLQTQINDIALAMAAQLSGQQPKDYGFDALQTQPSLIFAYHYLGFSIDEKRETAFKKWKEYKAAQEKKK